ncbi:MAG: hypothetical protein BAJATHORv1_10167 [Candidatus Thorarchaeota archaeon]|nr:MAG: hypothetical protein BAJATHORv1_10167 [Candidatus Thorarchaeota archaeon]
MVKHPKYQAMDEARQIAIPKAFEKFCPDDFVLDVIEPKSDSRPGPIPRPTFRVFSPQEVLLAHFHPNGYSECHDVSFQEIYEKMKVMIEEAAKRGYEEFQGL